MVNKVDLTRPVLPVAQPQPTKSKSSIQNQETSFSEVLQSQLQKNQVQFSKHAKERMAARNIYLDSNQLKKLNQAVNSAANKGAKDSLVLFPHAALIVSVASRTVVTAIDERNLKDNVFTNIDSAVII